METVLEPADDLRPGLDAGMRRRAFFAALFFALGLQLPAAAADAKASGEKPVVSVVEAETGCIAALDDGDGGGTCGVAEFGEIGAVEGRRFHYAVYQYQNPRNSVLDRTRVVVFEAVAPGMMRAVIAPEGDPAIGYDKPRLLRSADRVLLHIPASESGTGNFNRERLFVWRADQWRDVDTTAWLDDLVRRLPAGYGAWKGIYPDYVVLRASTPLWRKGDGNACPTGGRADLLLGWRGDRIVLRDVRLRKAAECG
jgi:hypothetical protein